MWMKGAPDPVHWHIYDTFLSDRQAKYFVTARKYCIEDLTADGLEFVEQTSGSHGLGGERFYDLLHLQKDQ